MEFVADVSETTRRLLACAAVIGDEASLSLVGATVCVGDDVLVAALEEAKGAGLLVDAGNAWSAACAFADGLVREAVYDEIPVVDRRRLDLRVARALLDGAEPRADALSAAGGHERAAGPLADRDEVVDLTTRAGGAARRLYAWDEAATHAEAALDMLEQAGAPFDRRGEMAELAGTMLSVAGADLRRAVRRMGAALEYYRRAHDTRSRARLCGRLGVAVGTHPTVMDIPRAMRHLAAAEPGRSQGAAGGRIGIGTAGGGIVGSRTEQAGVAAGRALRVVGGTGRGDHWAWSLSADAYDRFNTGDLATARELLETAWGSAVDLGDETLAWNAALMLGRHSVAFLADPRTAEHWCGRALALGHLDALRQRKDLFDLVAVAAGTRGDLAAARHTAASLDGEAVVARFLAMWDGDWEAAQRSWQAALRNDFAAGDLLDATLDAIGLAGVHVQLGHDLEAVATLRQALAWSVDGPLVPAELTVRAELARLLPVHGAVGEAAAHLARCDEILATGQDWRGRAGHVQLARAAVAGARGNESLAASAYAAAVQVFVTFDLPWQRALALGEWGRWLTSTGSPAQAEAKQAGAREIYTTLGASQRWHGGLLEPDRGTPQTVTGAQPLTVREREVLHLIAEGLSDRDIARRLVISPHTVHRHVANLRTKLGQPSRAAAVAYATRHKLI
jgi:DNA-binding NarL/FixJ family response regulator